MFTALVAAFLFLGFNPDAQAEAAIQIFQNSGNCNGPSRAYLDGCFATANGSFYVKGAEWISCTDSACQVCNNKPDFTAGYSCQAMTTTSSFQIYLEPSAQKTSSATPLLPVNHWLAATVVGTLAVLA